MTTRKRVSHSVRGPRKGRTKKSYNAMRIVRTRMYNALVANRGKRKKILHDIATRNASPAGQIRWHLYRPR